MHQTNKKTLLNRKWYVQGLNASPAVIHAAEVSGIKYMHRNFDFGYTNFIHIFKDGYDEIHYDMADLEKLAQEVISSYYKNKKHLSKLLALWKKDSKNFYAYLKIILENQNYISDFSNRELIAEYKKISQFFYQIFATSHLIEPIALTTDIKLRDQIKNQIPEQSQKIFNHYFFILIQQTFSSYLNEYNRALKNLITLTRERKTLHALFKNADAEKIKSHLLSDSKIKNLFNQHMEKYFWINSTLQEGINYTWDDLIMVIQRIIKKEDTIIAYDKKFFYKNLEAKNKLIKKLNLSDETIRLIRLLDFTAKWQDDRKREMIVGAWMLDKFVREIADRFGLEKENLHYFLPEELSVKKLRDKDSLEEARARQKLSVYLFYKNEKQILTGNEAKKFIKLLKGKDQKTDQCLNGIAAAMGKVIGKAKICLTMKDINNFKEGEILVTSMTRPEFVPAMKKALAIVTDEGGLTCHAAIISRELKKPCLIATKFATKILKNGDMVEVNANHGWVKILEKN